LNSLPVKIGYSIIMLGYGMNTLIDNIKKLSIFNKKKKTNNSNVYK